MLRGHHYGELDEEIIMDQAEGFVSEVQGKKVCRLKHSIYRLKQSSRQRFLQFHKSVLIYGFTVVEEDCRMNLKHSKDRSVILTLYVNDILMASNDKKLVK